MSKVLAAQRLPCLAHGVTRNDSREKIPPRQRAGTGLPSMHSAPAKPPQWGHSQGGRSAGVGPAGVPKLLEFVRPQSLEANARPHLARHGSDPLRAQFEKKIGGGSLKCQHDWPGRSVRTGTGEQTERPMSLPIVPFRVGSNIGNAGEGVVQRGPAHRWPDRCTIELGSRPYGSSRTT